MSNVVIVMGLQNGLEDTSRIAKQESCDTSIAIRVGIGSNPLFPLAINNPNVLCIIPSGAAFCPIEILSELEAKFFSHNCKPNILISEDSQMILYHTLILNRVLNPKSIYSFNRENIDIGWAIAEKANHLGLRASDFRDGNWGENIEKELELFPNGICSEKMNLHDLLQQWKKSYASVQVKLAPYITNVDDVILHNIEQDNKIVIEGGSFGLDINYGTYRGPISVTSSSIAAAAGIGPMDITRVVGVINSITLRNDEESFITKCSTDEIKDLTPYLGIFPFSYQAGWLNLVELKKAIGINSITELAIMNFDVLGLIISHLGYCKVCTAYSSTANINEDPIQTTLFSKTETTPYFAIKPTYKKFVNGWDIPSSIGEEITYDSLSDSAKEFIKFIEDYLHVPVHYIGLGEKTTIIEKALD